MVDKKCAWDRRFILNFRHFVELFLPFGGLSYWAGVRCVGHNDAPRDMSGEKGLECSSRVNISSLVPQLEPMLFTIDFEELHAKVCVCAETTIYWTLRLLFLQFSGNRAFVTLHHFLSTLKIREDIFLSEAPILTFRLHVRTKDEWGLLLIYAPIMNGRVIIVLQRGCIGWLAHLRLQGVSWSFRALSIIFEKSSY